MQKQSNEELIELIKEGIDIRDNYEKLYFQNKGFICLVIRKFSKPDQTVIEYEDLMQQAFIGLVNAVNAYDVNKGKFTTIFYWYIIQSLQQFLAQQVNVSKDMKYKIKKYVKAYEELHQRLDRLPTDNEVMEEMSTTKKQLVEIRQSMSFTLSLDEVINNEDSTTRLDLISDNSIDIQERLEQDHLKNIIQEALNKLPDVNQKIIHERYYKRKTLKQISIEENQSSARIRQIEDKGITLLQRDYVLKRKLDGYVDSYRTIGVQTFKRTRTSSVENVVLEREKWLERWERMKSNEC